MDYFYTVDLTEDIFEEYDELEIQEKDLNILCLEDSCRLSLNPKKSLANILSSESNYDFIKKEVKDMLEQSDDDNDTYISNLQELFRKMTNSSKEEFYEPFKKIYIYGDNDSIIDYIKSNPQIRNFEIVKMSPFSLSDAGLSEAKKDFETIKSATGCPISVVIAGNEEPLNLENFQKVLDIIDNIVIEIKKLHLSPLETVLYVYDLVRERKYQEESSNEYHTKSRDLASVLLGDKIVCAGFVNLFNTILEKLDIKCIPFRLLSTIKGEDHHVQSLVLIDDPKYAVNGLYLFDPTGECKENDNSYLSSYYNFAKTSREMNILYENSDLEPYYPFLDKEKINYLDSILPDKISTFEMGKYHLIKGMNPLLRLLGEPTMSLTDAYSKKDFIDSYNKIYNLCNKLLPIETFIKAFMHVRSLEYYHSPNIFPFDLATIEEATYSNSYYKIPISIEEQRLLKVLGVKISQVKKSKVVEIVNNNIDEKRILEIKLARQLRNKLNNC